MSSIVTPMDHNEPICTYHLKQVNLIVKTHMKIEVPDIFIYFSTCFHCLALWLYNCRTCLLWTMVKQESGSGAENKLPRKSAQREWPMLW